MNYENILDVFLVCLMVFPILKGFICKFSSKSYKERVFSVQCSLSFLLCILCSVMVNKNIFIEQKEGIYSTIYSNIPKVILELVNNAPFIIYVIFIPTVALFLYKVFQITFVFINKIFFDPILESLDKHIGDGVGGRVLGAVFEIPKAVVNLIVCCLIISAINLFTTSSISNDYISNSKIYNYVNGEILSPITTSNIAKSLPNLLNNSFKVNIDESLAKNNGNIEESKNVIIYYNGVTLDQAIKSNESLESFARELVNKEVTSIDKAEKIYSWITKNITYDYDKAEDIINNNYSKNSGAITAFNSRKGICFDYASLYVTMCKANNIPVRLITGMGFDGEQWVNHSWNQVYIKEIDNWIDVDCTFGISGNYFNNLRFKIDHKEGKVAGEW